MSPLDPDRTLAMTPGEILCKASDDGVSVWLSPTGTIKVRGDQAAVNRWLPVFRARKPALVAYLRDCLPAPERPDLPGELVADDGADTAAADIPPETVEVFEQAALAPPELPSLSRSSEARRQRVLAMLAREGVQYAVLVDDPNTDPVVMAVATPDGTREVLIPRGQYDPFEVLTKVNRWDAGRAGS